MRLPKRIIWKISFIVYALFTASNITYFFDPQAPVLLYYHILIAWDSLFALYYILNIAAILFSVIALLPFWGFLYDKPVLSAKFWTLFLWMRVILEFCGRSYEVNFIKSISFDHPTTAFLIILTLITINLPSYIAIWLYIKTLRRQS